MTEIQTNAEELQQAEITEVSVVKTDGVFRSILRGLFWPFGIVVHTYRGIWWLLGYRQPPEAVTSPGRQSLAGRKRMSRFTRLLLFFTPRWLQGKLGYPVSSSIGLSLSPEIRVSPTKPCGKGSKRKQDELDEDEDEEEEPSQTWVQVLSQELADDEDPEQDPDYEPSTVETESEEYRSHNNTESDIEVAEKGVVVIEDVETDVEVPAPAPAEVPDPVEVS